MEMEQQYAVRRRNNICDEWTNLECSAGLYLLHVFKNSRSPQASFVEGTRYQIHTNATYASHVACRQSFSEAASSFPTTVSVRVVGAKRPTEEKLVVRSEPEITWRLDVKLAGSQTVVGSRNFEVHVTKVIFHAQNIREKHKLLRVFRVHGILTLLRHCGTGETKHGLHSAKESTGGGASIWGRCLIRRH